MKQSKYRYYVSYFCKAKIGDPLGIKMNGHLSSKVIEITHPVTTQAEVNSLQSFLQGQEGAMWTVQLLAFSLMWVEHNDSSDT